MTRSKAIIEAVVKPTKKSKRFVKSDYVEWRNAAGNIHRDDGPALEYNDGSKSWFINGKLHRLDGPASLLSDGRQYWFKRSKLHREDGPAWITPDARKWYRNGQLFRADGPAVVRGNGTQEWWLNDKRHRLDGPAVESSLGSCEFYIHGRQFTEDEFYRYVDQDTGEVLVPPGRKLTHDP